MKIREIHYNEEFLRQFKLLPKHIQQRSVKIETFFRQNPFHPSLRLHQLKGNLKGLWSISINLQYRIIFDIMNDGNVLFVSIGTHAIYEGQ